MARKPPLNELCEYLVRKYSKDLSKAQRVQQIFNGGEGSELMTMEFAEEIVETIHEYNPSLNKKLKQVMKKCIMPDYSFGKATEDNQRIYIKAFEILNEYGHDDKEAGQKNPINGDMVHHLVTNGLTIAKVEDVRKLPGQSGDKKSNHYSLLSILTNFVKFFTRKEK